MCAPLPSRSPLAHTDGLRIKTIEYPGLATITENFHGSSRRVLRQTIRLGETRFAYQVTGACITHVSDPNKVCTANCPNEDSWDNYEAGWRFYGGQIVATRLIESSGRETLRRFNARGIVLEKPTPPACKAGRCSTPRTKSFRSPICSTALYAKEAGKMRSKCNEWAVKDGDVLNFLFNV